VTCGAAHVRALCDRRARADEVAKRQHGATQDLTINQLYSRWGALNRWILLLDVDEYLVFPGGGAGAEWLRALAAGAAPAPEPPPPVASLPQLLRALNATPGAAPPFDGLRILSRRAFGAYDAPLVGAGTAPACSCLAYTVDDLDRRHTHGHSKLLVYKPHVPLHTNLHVLTHPGNRALDVHSDVAVIQHMLGCAPHAGAAPPLPHLAACDAAARWAMDALASAFADKGLLVPAGTHAAGPLFLDGTGRFAIADAPRAAVMRDDAIERSARCRPPPAPLLGGLA
jgi:hypothetical protein